MKKLVLSTLALLLAVSLFVSCGNKKPVISAKNVDKSKLEKDITVKVGETFSIELSSNASTGYKWELASKIKPSVVELVGSEYSVPDNDSDVIIVGQGGIEKWSFKAVEKGEVYLYFTYLRGEDLGKETYYKIKVE